MHIAIVSYTFPPSKEIGGRRWAKFSRYLSKMGQEVTVVCSNSSVNLEWYKKEFPGISFRLLPKHYPTWLTGNTKSVFEKLLYFLVTRILSPLTKKNLFDRGYAWRKPMLNSLEDLHAKNPIDVIIVTGAPFSLFKYGADFKRRHSEVFLVGDIRDPWTWGSYYGIPTMTKAKKKFQEYSERITMEWCDMICYPTQNMGNFLKRKYKEYAKKLYLLPHAFEPDKFPKVNKETKRKGFIYGGTLYNGIEEYIKKLSEIVKANPDIDFEWDIYTSTDFPLINSNFANGRIRKNSFIPEEELFKRISESIAYLVFFPVQEKDLISTKFFEIIHTETPILYIGEEGDVGRFIRENRLGVHILPENIEHELPKYLSGDIAFENGYFDVSQYTFSSVTEKFLLLVSSKSKHISDY